MPVTFPATPLACKVYIALGADLTQPGTWTWTDITQWVRFADGITTSQGRPDESGTVRVSSASLRLDNRDGRFSRRNPSSPYYGRLTYNTPIWGTVDPGTGVVTRLQMYVNEWPTRWDRSGRDSTVPITCAGILRRLAQGSDPKSALRRTFTAVGAVEPTAWWPLEDGSKALAGASGLPGGAFTDPIVGPAVFGASPIGDSGAASGANFLGGGGLTAPTGRAVAAAPDGWEFECVVGFETLPTLTVGQAVAVVQASSGVDPAATMGIGISNISGTLYWVDYIFDSGGSGGISLSTVTQVVTGRTYHLRGVAFQSGAAGRFRWYVDGTSALDGFDFTLMMPDKLQVNVSYDPTLPDLCAFPDFVAHLAFRTPYLVAASTTQPAATGYAGEMAHTRIARLCEEEGGVPLATTATVSAALGAQSVGTFLSGVREAEAVDQGVVYETAWGLGYQALSERYNATVGLALDFEQGHIAVEPEPADDDQRLRNRWRVSRSGGSDVTVEETDGPLGTGAGGPGIYDDSVTLLLHSDDELGNQGGWRRHLGTVDEDRWPNIALRFHGTPDLITEWTALPYGARMTAANPPAQVAPDAIDAIIEGHTEHWDPLSWEAVLNTSPYRPYEVHVVEGTGNRGRVDNADSTLAVNATSTATTISVTSTGPPWRTGAVSFDIEVGGERMTVTNITDAVTDSFSRTVSNGWGTANSGQAWTNELGIASKFSANGTAGLHAKTVAGEELQSKLSGVVADMDVTVTVSTSSVASYNDFGIQRVIDANNLYRLVVAAAGAANFALNLQKSVAGVSTTLALVDTGIAKTTSALRLRLQIADTMIRAKAWLASGGEPSAWSATTTDTSLTSGNVILQSYNQTVGMTHTWDDLAVNNPQTFTVTRSVNTVIKAQTATTPTTKVRLWKPGVYAL